MKLDNWQKSYCSQCNLKFHFILLLIFKFLSCHLETCSTAAVGAHHLTFLTEFIATTWVIPILVTHSCHLIYISLILSHTKSSEWQPATALWFSGFCIITSLFLALLSAQTSSLWEKCNFKKSFLLTLPKKNTDPLHAYRKKKPFHLMVPKHCINTHERFSLSS